MTELTRWGILATGGIAARFARELAQVPDATLAAVGSRSAEAAQRFAEQFPQPDGAFPRVHGSWAALAADPDVDVVYIATPHSAHHAAATLCLTAGKPLLVEKPFTLDLATAQDLITQARQRQLFLMEAMWTRTLPAIRQMLTLIGDGAIGEVTSVHAEFGLGRDFEPSHRMRDPLLGGGALLDLGVYPVTFAQLLLGEPHIVRAHAALHPEGTDANTGIVLGFPTGAIATLHCGVRGNIGKATVVGTQGRIELTNGFHGADRFTLHRGDSAPELIAAGAPSGLHYQAIEVGRCLREGLLESPLVPLASTIATMRTLDAVRSQIGVHY